MNQPQRNQDGSFFPYVVAGVMGLAMFGLIIYSVGGFRFLDSGNSSTAQTGFYTTADVNVRKCASTNCRSLGQYPAGTKLDITYGSYDELPDWVPVSWTDDKGVGQSGFISKTVITMQSPYTQASTTSSQATTTDQSISSNAVNQTNTQQNIVSEQTDTDLSAIVSEWKNRVAQVTCGWMDNSQVQGAATIAENKQYGLVAITNAHVESDQSGGAPSSCVFGIYGLGTRIINYDQNNAQFFSFADKGYDVAYIKLDATSFAYDQGAFQTYGTRPLKICRDNDVNIGDKILLLGYPWNGSKSSVTATQGIVSGFDGNYYVTDAKIDHGNSGGAAILIKKDCWLGIPSSAVVGSIESYGRIFKGSILLSD